VLKLQAKTKVVTCNIWVDHEVVERGVSFEQKPYSHPVISNPFTPEGAHVK